MFFGRAYELHELEKFYQKDIFQMPVIYGRRRVGKTKIIQEFVKNKKHIFFTAIESNSQKNLELLSRSIWEALMPDSSMLPPFRSYEEAFSQIHKMAQQEKLVFVIDEYPYWAAAEKSISSLLQSYIDNFFSSVNMMIILCGSSMSFMENQVLGYQSPLYGRRTAQFKVLPFNYKESQEFVKHYTPYEKAIVYGITGGIPKYLELIDDRLSLKENIIELFLKPSGYLYEEPGNLLKQELREPANYNAVIEAIATGASKLNEIATATGMDTATASTYLKTLIPLGIVYKESPVTEEKNKKKTLYSLADNMFCFWYRYIPNNMYYITSGQFEVLYDTCIKPSLNDYMGTIFEEMCRQYLRCSDLDAVALPRPQTLGRWWGTDPQTHTEVEIDIIGINTAARAALFGECKFRNEKTGMNVLQGLMEKSYLFPQYATKKYLIFSMSGFQQKLLEEGQDGRCTLISLEDMY